MGHSAQCVSSGENAQSSVEELRLVNHLLVGRRPEKKCRNMLSQNGTVKHAHWQLVSGQRPQRESTIVDHILSASINERAKNCTIVKKLLHCTYYLAKNRIPHCS